jgi:hypothetical protein
MRFTRIREDEDLAKVVRRMYRSEVKGGLADAEKLVVSANPHLSDPAAIRPGAFVIIPDVPGTRVIDEGDNEVQAVTTLLANALRGFDDLGSFLDPQLAQEEEEISNNVAVLKSREVQALASKEPDAKKRVAAIQKQADEQLQSIKALRATQKTALSEFQTGREALLKMLNDLARS